MYNAIKYKEELEKAAGNCDPKCRVWNPDSIPKFSVSIPECNPSNPASKN